MSRIFNPDPEARILVMGDVMLDRYIYGETRRISPEAPVPVVRVTHSEERPGGAANVALNISAYGIPCTLAGITGEDNYAARLIDILGQHAVDCCFQRHVGLPTITKERVISQHQQLLRLDFESSLVESNPGGLIEIIESQPATTRCVVFSDYAKGCLLHIEQLINAARQRNLYIMIDPKGQDFHRYSGANLLTPNQLEFEAIVGVCHDNSTLEERAGNLCRELGLDALLVTRGEQGMSMVEVGNGAIHVSTEAREVFDVTGAGDTVIATLASAMASGYDLGDAMMFANKAASLSVAKLGAVSVGTDELNRVLNPKHNIKIMDEAGLEAIVEQTRRENRKVSFTNGCFDILHAGHVSYLSRAAALGDMLIVAVNTDESVRKLKGADRPVNGLQQRMQVLAGLEAVDYVVAFPDETPERLIQRLQPDILVKGADYLESEIIGSEFIRSRGGEVHRIPLEEGQSTSAVIKAIKNTGKSV